MQRFQTIFTSTPSARSTCRGWSSGRVVLVGDAAYAPSFLSGQGSSIALVGAYVLAGELATHADPVEAFTAYERIARPFVEANQALAGSGGGFLLPRTPRNSMLAISARYRAVIGTEDRVAARHVEACAQLPFAFRVMGTR